MKKIAIFIFVLMLVASFTLAKESRDSVPKVRYIYPKDEEVVDLTNKESLTFMWKSVPIPGGGRMSYRFNLYKEWGYDVVVSEELDPKVFSIDIPRDKFEDGATYTWQVKQRDRKMHVWSMDYRWSFRIKK